MQPGQRLQRIGLVGETGHVGPVAGDQPGLGGVREERAVADPGRQQPYAGRREALLHVHHGARGRECGEHPGRLDRVLRPPGCVQYGHPVEGVGQFGMAGLRGGPGDERRVAEVHHPGQPLHEQARELLGGAPAEERALPVLGQEAGSQRGDRRVPGARSPLLQDGSSLGRDDPGPGEHEGLGIRQVHRRKPRLGQREQPLGEGVQRLVLVGQCS